MASDSTQQAGGPLPATSRGRGGRRRLKSLLAVGLISPLLALVPALLLLDVQQRELGTLDRRLRGHQLLVAVAPLASALPWHRDLSTRLLLGDASVEGALRRAATEVRSALRQGSAMTAQHADALALSAPWQELAERWAHLESRYPRLAAPDNVEAHNRLLQHVAEFLGLIGQRSELLLERSAATYFLILCESGDMPALARHAAMLRAHALLAGREVSPDRRERIVRTLTEAHAALDRAAADLSAAYAADAASRELLDQRSARALELVREVLEQADAVLVPGHTLDLDESAWFSATTQAVESLQGAHDMVSARVTVLLAAEAQALRTRQQATQALAVLIGSCALLGLLVLARSLTQSRRDDVAPGSSAPAGDPAVDAARPAADSSI